MRSKVLSAGMLWLQRWCSPSNNFYQGMVGLGEPEEHLKRVLGYDCKGGVDIQLGSSLDSSATPASSHRPN